MTDKIDKLKIAMGLADDGITPLSEPLTVVEVPSSEFQENKLFQQKLLDLLDVRKPNLPEDFGKFLTLRLGTDVNSNTQGVLMAAWEDIKVVSEDSTTTEVTGVGSAADPIKVEVKISSEEGNQLSVEADGLFVPPLPEDLVYEAPEDGKEYVRKDGTWEELVIPEPVLELKQLEDVSVEGATNGQILSYDEAESKWVAKDNEGGEFIINDLNSAAIVQDADYLPLSQVPEISARFWRISVKQGYNGLSSGGSTSAVRVFELEFRELEDVPVSHTDNVYVHSGVDSDYPVENAFDGDITSSTRKGASGDTQPLNIGIDFEQPTTIRQIAIYVGGSASNRRYSPGLYDIQVSDDGEVWTTVRTVDNVENTPTTSTWVTELVVDGRQQNKVTVQQLKSVFGGGGGSGIQSIVAGDNVTVDSTDPANPIVSATGGGGSEFIINDLDNTAVIQDSDFLPISQVLESGISAKYWRIVISDNMTGSTEINDHRCHEIEFRESKLESVSHVGDSIIGENVNSIYSADKAFDGNTSSFARRGNLSSPWSLGVEFDAAKVVKFVAIYYPTTSSNRGRSPGVFTIEASDDNITWTEMASYNVKEEIVSGGWYTFSVTGSEPQQKKVSVQQLKEHIVEDITSTQQDWFTYFPADQGHIYSSNSAYATKGQILEVVLPLKIRYISSKVGPGTYNIGVAKLSPEFEILDKAELVGVSSGAPSNDLGFVQGHLDKTIEFEPGDILYEYVTITGGTPTTPARCPYHSNNHHYPLLGLTFIEAFAATNNTMNIGDTLVNMLPGNTSWTGTCPVISVNYSYQQ